jgi:hypothetical protein
MAIIELTHQAMVSHQTWHMSDSKYLERFRTNLSAIESAGGSTSLHPGMVTDALTAAGVVDPTAATDDEQSAARAAAKGMAEATLFLLLRNTATSIGTARSFNDFIKGRDYYPVSLTDSYELMLHDDRRHDN